MRRAPLEWAVFYGVAAIIGFLVVYPIGMMIGGTFVSDTGSLTLEHWSNVKGLALLWEVLRNTLIVTISATLIALVIGLFLAFLVARTDLPMSSLFEFISIVPFITPPIIAGLAWQLLAEKQSGVLNIILDGLGIGWRLDVMTLVGVTLVSALYLIPFVFLITSGVLRSINPDLEEASVVTGAGKFRTFLYITLPLLKPGLSSAALLAFMYSNILFGIHATLGMPKNIWFLTTSIYQSLSVIPAETNRAAILACILMVFGMLATYMQIRILAGEQSYETLTGKGFRTKLINLGPWRWVAWSICMLYVFVVIVLPYLVLFLRSMKPFMFVPGMTWADAFTGWEFDKYMLVLSGEDPLMVRLGLAQLHPRARRRVDRYGSDQRCRLRHHQDRHRRPPDPELPLHDALHASRRGAGRGHPVGLHAGSRPALWNDLDIAGRLCDQGSAAGSKIGALVLFAGAFGA